MSKMQQSAPPTMNTPPSAPLNLVSTEQIQKYLDENKNLIMAILECQKLGKVAECAQYQTILQKNLMYLAAIADAQPPGSSTHSQMPTGSVAPQGESLMQQAQASTPLQQQPAAKLPFQLNALRPQDQHNQLLQFQQQQQLQGHFNLGGGANNNNNLNLLMHPGHGNMMANGQGSSTLGRDNRDRHADNKHACFRCGNGDRLLAQAKAQSEGRLI